MSAQRRRLIVATVCSVAALVFVGWHAGLAQGSIVAASPWFPEEPPLAPNQESRCADCHFANPDAPARLHLSEWDLSAHGKNDVGCESCHGGDPTTFDFLPAHAGILPSDSVASPAHRTNLPRTCGRCHTGPYVAFQESRHLELLEGGDGRVPTCSTCHGSVAAHALSPRAIEAECAECHGPGSVAERLDAAPLARQLLESIGRVRATLKEARSLIDRVSDEERRASLEDDYRQAEVPLIEATNAGHAFEFTRLEERLATARRRAQALMLRLLGLPTVASRGSK